MSRIQTVKSFVTPGHALGAVYGKTSGQLQISEKRRDEIITSSIYASFCNQEFGMRLKLPANYKKEDHALDARGIDMVLVNDNGRQKKIQVKGVYLSRAIERRKRHRTKGAVLHYGQKSRSRIETDSKELTKIMKEELKKVIQDYNGLFLLIHVMADFASQTSLEIAMKNSAKVVEGFKAREVWFIRNIPVRAIYGKRSKTNCFSYKLMKIIPDRHTYSFAFSL